MKSPTITINKRKIELDKKFIKIQSDELRLKRLEETLLSLQYRVALKASPIVKDFCNLRFENISRLKHHLNDSTIKKKDKKYITCLLNELIIELQNMGDSRADLFLEEIEKVEKIKNINESEDSHHSHNFEIPIFNKDQANSKIEIKALFRQLAKAFHPDIELNQNLKDEKTILMKKINEAYENQDLFSLLKLEKEHMSPREFGEDKIDLYIKHINNRLKEIKIYEANLKKHGPLSSIYRSIYSDQTAIQDSNISNELKNLEEEVLKEKELQQFIWDRSSLISYLKH